MHNYGLLIKNKTMKKLIILLLIALASCTVEEEATESRIIFDHQDIQVYYDYGGNVISFTFVGASLKNGRLNIGTRFETYEIVRRSGEVVTYDANHMQDGLYRCVIIGNLTPTAGINAEIYFEVNLE